MEISTPEKIKALRDICGVGIIDAKNAILYCETHPEANEVGYIMAKGLAVRTFCTPEERIIRFSNGAKTHPCGIRWAKFLETGVLPKEEI